MDYFKIFLLWLICLTALFLIGGMLSLLNGQPFNLQNWQKTTVTGYAFYLLFGLGILFFAVVLIIYGWKLVV